MFPTIFLLFLPVLPGIAGVPVGSGAFAISPRPDNFAFEEEIRQFFENIRRIMKEGDPEMGIQPLEPLRHDVFHFDFFMEETELKGVLRETVLRNVSDFEIRDLTVSLGSKIEINGTVRFDKIEMSGLYDVTGSLFGDLPVNGLGSYRIVARDLRTHFDWKIRSKASIPYFQVFNGTFQLGGISVVYNNTRKDEMNSSFEEKFLLGIAERFRSLYLPRLLNTLKILINDFIERMYDRWESRLLSPRGWERPAGKGEKEMKFYT